MNVRTQSVQENPARLERRRRLCDSASKLSSPEERLEDVRDSRELQDDVVADDESTEPGRECHIPSWSKFDKGISP